MTDASVRPRVVVIGAAGEMLTVAVRSLARHDDVDLVLADIDEERLVALQAETVRSSAGRVEIAQADLFDADALAALLRGSDLVVNGAGPSYRTAEPVISACIAAGVSYLDIGDDIEAIDAAFEFDAKAREVSVDLFVGCGASPGLTNVIAAELLERLDSADSVHVAWCVGDEGDHRAGPAVLEHVVHMVSGATPTWEDGRRGSHPAWQRRRAFDFGPPLGTAYAFECSHPEVVTLPRSYPGLREARCYGAVRPLATNAVLAGVGDAVRRGSLSDEEATDFLGSVLAGSRGSMTGWRAAWSGLRAGRRSGLLSWPEIGRFFRDGALGRHEPYQGGIACEVEGMRNGRRVRLRRSTARSGLGTPFSSMAEVTGTAAAAFVHLALASPRGGGVFAPEAWAAPQAVHEEMRRRGFEDYLGPVVEVDV